MKHLLRRLAAACLIAAMLLSSAAALTVDQALDVLDEAYLNPIPDEARRAESLEELFQLLGDPYTTYMTEAEYLNFLINLSGTSSVTGIGIAYTQTEEGVSVTSVLPGGGSEEAGLLPGDLILSADGTSLKGVSDPRDLLSGEAGTTVELSVLRAGQVLSFTVERRVVLVPNTTLSLPLEGVGMLSCASFSDETGSYVRSYVSRYADDIRLWIVDLRSNTGGVTRSALEATGVFTGKGRLLELRDKTGAAHYQSYTADALTDAPVIVLTNYYTASASEIFAASIRDTGRGISVGTRTYGKGVAQSLFDETTHSDYFSGDVMKVTTERFYSAKGNTSDTIGVIPTLLVGQGDTEAVALLLCGQAPEHTAGWLRLTLAGIPFYVDAATAAREEPEALEALLSALAPDAQVALGSGSGWREVSVSEAIFTLTGEAGGSRRFTDVSGSPYADAINALAAYEVLQGTGDGLFRPGDTITRAQVCAMLAQALGIYTAGDDRFSDVAPHSWYAGAITAMAQRGFVNGVGGGRFAPDAAMTCEEFLTILGRLAAFLNTGALDLSAALEAGQGADSGFDEWARNAVLLLSQLGRDEAGGPVSLLHKDLSDIDPKAPILREEAAALLYNLLTGVGILVY